MVNHWIEFLFLKISPTKSDNLGYNISWILTLFLTMISFYYYFKVRKIKNVFGKDFAHIFGNVTNVLLILFIRSLFSTINYLIWTISDGRYLLNLVYVLICWSLISLNYLRIVQRNYFFKIKRKNQKYIFTTIVIFTAILILLMYIGFSLAISILSFFYLILTYLFYAEFKNLSHGTSKFRLKIMTLIFIFIGLYGYAFAIFYFYIPTLFPNQFLPAYYVFWMVLVTNGIATLFSVGFYWLIDIPEIMR